MYLKIRVEFAKNRRVKNIPEAIRIKTLGNSLAGANIAEMANLNISTYNQSSYCGVPLPSLGEHICLFDNMSSDQSQKCLCANK